MGSVPQTPISHVCFDVVQWDSGAGARGLPVIAPVLFSFTPKSDLGMCENRNQG